METTETIGGAVISDDEKEGPHRRLFAVSLGLVKATLFPHPHTKIPPNKFAPTLVFKPMRKGWWCGKLHPISVVQKIVTRRDPPLPSGPALPAKIRPPP